MRRALAKRRTSAPALRCSKARSNTARTQPPHRQRSIPVLLVLRDFEGVSRSRSPSCAIWGARPFAHTDSVPRVSCRFGFARRRRPFQSAAPDAEKRAENFDPRPFHTNQWQTDALAREQAQPIRDAYAALPQIPKYCQWSNFLRTHDELDLGRLSEAERAEVFHAFGPDANMQLYNRGIRQRAAPMLSNNRERLALAHSLILTLPGMPVLRYGDEIGMGENLSLNERDSVRTPMQWADAPNAGF